MSSLDLSAADEKFIRRHIAECDLWHGQCTVCGRVSPPDDYGLQRIADGDYPAQCGHMDGWDTCTLPPGHTQVILADDNGVYVSDHGAPFDAHGRVRQRSPSRPLWWDDEEGNHSPPTAWVTQVTTPAPVKEPATYTPHTPEARAAAVDAWRQLARFVRNPRQLVLRVMDPKGGKAFPDISHEHARRLIDSVHRPAPYKVPPKLGPVPPLPDRPWLNHHPDVEDQAEWDGMTVTASRSEIDGSLYVIVDTSGAPAGNVRIDLNDGTVWDADPEAPDLVEDEDGAPYPDNLQPLLRLAVETGATIRSEWGQRWPAKVSQTLPRVSTWDGRRDAEDNMDSTGAEAVVMHVVIETSWQEP
jgi:hypothetical protein